MAVQQIDLRAEAEHMKDLYDADDSQRGFNAIIYGKSGTGKTMSYSTARRPIHVDSFDPGGLITVRSFIKQGWLIPDTRWERRDDIKNPTLWHDWLAEMQRRREGGYFDQLGTYVLDSATTWGDAAMNVILKKNARVDGVPWQNDYQPQMVMLKRAIEEIVRFGCDCIFICHEDMLVERDDKKAISVVKDVYPMLTGKLRVRIPLLFSEIYHAETREGPGGLKYEWLTRQEGVVLARTRLGTGGLFKTYEPQNVKELLKKANMNSEDLPGWGG